MTLPPLPEPYGTGAYPYPDTYTKAQMLAFQKATVELCIRTVVDLGSDTTSQWPHRIISAMKELK
jgi:hypothetical protein